MIKLLGVKCYAIDLVLVSKRCSFTNDSKIMKIFNAFWQVDENGELYSHPLNLNMADKGETRKYYFLGDYR